jgi:hypothetical protein
MIIAMMPCSNEGMNNAPIHLVSRASALNNTIGNAYKRQKDWQNCRL